MFDGCGSPWKNPWRKIIVIHASVMRYASSRRSSADQADDVDVAYVGPFQTLECEHAVRRVTPPDPRHRDALVSGEVPPERLRVAGLLLVVELLPDRPGELVHQRVRIDEVECPDALARKTDGGPQQLQIGLDLARRVGPLHLDDDVRAVRQRRAVHLADRGRGDRRLLEAQERALEGEPEIDLHDLLDLLEGNRRDVVLELAQLDDDVRRHEVRAGRQQLPELDERRPELVEHLAQAPPAFGDRLVGRRAATVEEIAEAVASRDADDLGETADRALTRGCHSAQCVSRPSRCTVRRMHSPGAAGRTPQCPPRAEGRFIRPGGQPRRSHHRAEKGRGWVGEP